MRYLVLTSVLSSLLILSACSTSSDSSSLAIRTQSGVDTASDIPLELSAQSLASANYTLIDPTVRRALTQAGQDFLVPVRGGSYIFPASALVGHFRTVRSDTEHITYGDLTGDSTPEAIVRLQVGTDENSMVELAAFTASGGTAYQFAAFPLGHADVRNVAITDRTIRVNFMHTVPGDPGPRNTELVLEIPRK